MRREATSLFYARFNQQDVYRQCCQEPACHGDLHHKPEYERSAGKRHAPVESENCDRHPAVHARLPCRERQYVGFSRPPQGRAASECPFHAPDRRILEPDAENQRQYVVRDPRPGQQAPADGDRNEIHKPFPDQIGQRTSRSAMKRGQHRRLPFRPPRHLRFRHVPHAGHSHTRHTCRFTHIFHACRTAHFPHAVSPGFCRSCSRFRFGSCFCSCFRLRPRFPTAVMLFEVAVPRPAEGEIGP